MKLRLALGAGVVLALVAAFVAGRYSRPAKVVETVKVETKTVTVTEWRDRVVEKRVQGPVRVRTITIEKPGGERVVERVVDRGPVTTDTTTDRDGSAASASASASSTSRTTEGRRPDWSAGVSAWWTPEASSLTPDRLGLELDRRILGTVWLGARASMHSVDDPDVRLGAAIRMEF
jgi:hypothetical protein